MFPKKQRGTGTLSRMSYSNKSKQTLKHVMLSNSNQIKEKKYFFLYL